MTGKPGARLRLILVRHGRALDAEGRCIGHTDLAIAPEGAADIHAMCSLVASVIVGSARVVSSDLRRAFDSAAIIAAALRVPVEVDPRLREMSFGKWDGLHWSDLERNDGNRLRAWTDQWMSESPPGGESLRDLQQRAADWLREVAAASSNEHDGTIVIVSHAGWIRVAESLLLDRPLERLFEIPIDHAHVTIIDCRLTGSCLIAENVNSTANDLSASH